ncbi:glutaredoxin [Oxalobacteraceae bacterium GrIS 1.11]
MNISSSFRLGLVLLLCAGAAGAQVYKWKDANGITHFSDTPPSGEIAKVELKSYGSSPVGVDLPFELAEAVKNQPVTLYTTEHCEACDAGRAMLQARGVPYTEKTVNSAADQAAFKLAGGAGRMPMLLVGRRKYVGYEQGAWNGGLNAAAYPAQRMLPDNYKQAAGSPAAPPPRPPAEAPAPKPESLPPVNSAPDFQF